MINLIEEILDGCLDFLVIDILGSVFNKRIDAKKAREVSHKNSEKAKAKEFNSILRYIDRKIRKSYKSGRNSYSYFELGMETEMKERIARYYESKNFDVELTHNRIYISW